ncbi:MAG: glycosyltransferase family 4 protein [Lachnospiraceae bacterium]
MKKIKESDKITILALSWRDITSPNAGGAEVHTHEMLRRVDKNKYRIYHLATRKDGQPENEVIDGVTYLRHGNAITVITAAMRFYFLNKENIDLVIDQCNTHRFFTPLWVEKGKRIFYIHQLTKEIWDYSAKFPLSKIGKLLEESFLRLNRKDPVITVSESTRNELIDRGYLTDRIQIIYNGVSFQPWEHDKWYSKDTMPTFIYAGRYSPYKGIDVAVKALIRVKKDYPDAKLWILGKKDQEYVDRNLMPICQKDQLVWVDAEDDHPTGDVVSWGYVPEEKKLELLSRSWALVFPSIREGWGIPVTEAGCVGTPCIAFDSPGIRDAVDYGRAGYLCHENSVNGLAEQMRLVISDKRAYSSKRESAYRYSSQFQWEGTGKEFERFVQRILK